MDSELFITYLKAFGLYSFVTLVIALVALYIQKKAQE